MPRPYIGCAVKQLHPTARVEAARTAVRINPANATAARAAASLGITAPEHLALLTSKYWGPAGVKLTVSFLDNADAETRRKILEHMNAWAKSANVSFAQTAGIGQVRITRANSGYWSYLGTDILSIPTGEPTMNLQGFDAASTPDSEFYRVVRHETGHTLGFPHEHERPEIVALLDEAKTIAYFEHTQGWSESEVREQVLTPLTGLDPRSLASDVRSIMCYELPGDITRNGQPVPGGLDIDAEDYQLAATLYPKETGGGGGGNPPPSPGAGEVVVRATLRPGWYALYPARPKGRFSTLQVIQQVNAGHFGLQVAQGQVRDTAGQPWTPEDFRPLEVEVDHG